MDNNFNSDADASAAGAQKSPHVLILGAGPAGLGAGYELSRHKVSCTVVDKHERVGGLARTVDFEGFRFDIGPHRFFTKEDVVNKLWHEVLGPDFIRVPRLTRIFYRGKFFYYPLKPFNALMGLGLWSSFMAVVSYAYARVAYRDCEARSFEEWITFHFGRRLYETFFKTYTEKVWGIPCSKIGAEWASQRIRGLNLWRAAKNAFFGNRDGIRTLTDEFYYPREGAGMLYEKMAAAITAAGSQVCLNSIVDQIVVEECVVKKVRCSDGREFELKPGDQLLSSIPITEFVQKMKPAPSEDILKAARGLKYRDHLTVNLTYFGERPFPDNWIYVHSDEVRMARLTDYANFSRDMVPAEDAHGLAVEYFCFREDDVWQMDDAALIRMATEELTRIGMIRPENVRSGFVMREKDSYPAYYAGYEEHFELLKNFVKGLSNVQMIGRGGMFKYGNQDHATLSGVLAARNLQGERHDVWSVAADEDYIEEKRQARTS